MFVNKKLFTLSRGVVVVTFWKSDEIIVFCLSSRQTKIRFFIRILLALLLPKTDTMFWSEGGRSSFWSRERVIAAHAVKEKVLLFFTDFCYFVLISKTHTYTYTSFGNCKNAYWKAEERKMPSSLRANKLFTPWIVQRAAVDGTICAALSSNHFICM